eukprot:CAMPEP_0181396678 /NCGR_PEP_ID=MMETSP1110-20121109/36_1 /TAXON_ID=174948 /ORGANISM="Symbiodinium sp., Strain CCMP421" /LENGTH=148 /DNA_ID=CAMNT_0023518379 /DNA_START=368 /DNA_END=814 /DNA_ORIENTATION=+
MMCRVLEWELPSVQWPATGCLGQDCQQSSCTAGIVFTDGIQQLRADMNVDLSSDAGIGPTCDGGQHQTSVKGLAVAFIGEVGQLVQQCRQHEAVRVKLGPAMGIPHFQEDRPLVVVTHVLVGRVQFTKLPKAPTKLAHGWPRISQGMT